MTEAAENKTEKTAHSETRHFFRGEIYYADLGVGLAARKERVLLEDV